MSKKTKTRRSLLAFNSRSLLSRIALLGAIFFAACSLSSVAFARPGGGGSFASGGGGSHSSGGGGSFGGGGSTSFSGGGFSGSSNTYSSSGSGGASGILGFIVLIAIFILISVIKTRVNRVTRSAILNAEYQMRQPAGPPPSLALLQQRDPQLTEQAIFQRVHIMSDILREAWCNGEMKPARAFVSDGVFSRFNVQLGLMKGEGLRNVMADARVLNITLAGVSTTPPLDAVHVRLTAEARDANIPYNSSPQQAQQALAQKAVEPYTEVWTLVRRQGAQSKLQPAQVGKNCPSCGAPLDTAEMIKCKYCGALICSAEHDWVLAEITQDSEWYPESHDEVRGLNAMKQADPMLAREVLEDRGSYLFWKWIESARIQQMQPLRKCATQRFAANPAVLQPVAQTRDVAIGGSDVIMADAGGGGVDPDLDFVYVKLYWSAIFGQQQQATPMQSVARLARKAGVASKLSMTSVVCQSCGAPLTESDTTTCDHCHAEIAAGAQVWVLDAILQPGEVRERSHAPDAPLPDWLVPNIADPRERQILFTQMAALMASDGNLDAKEKKLLRLCAQRWNIPEPMVAQIIGNPRPVGTSTLQSASPQWFLAGLVTAAMMDGKVDSHEQAMLQNACAALGLPPDELQRQLAAAQQRMQQSQS
ncbi:MAG: hypothetical protein ABI183_15885 [Polyangiaceae bacterium]